MKRITFFVLLLWMNETTFAQDKPIVFKGATIITVTGQIFSGGTMVVQNGKIIAVGAAALAALMFSVLRPWSVRRIHTFRS